MNQKLFFVKEVNPYKYIMYFMVFDYGLNTPNSSISNLGGLAK